MKPTLDLNVFTDLEIVKSRIGMRRYNARMIAPKLSRKRVDQIRRKCSMGKISNTINNVMLLTHLIKIAGGVKFNNGVKIVGSGGVVPGADFTESFEDATWLTDNWDGAIRTRLTTSDRSADFVRTTDWKSVGSYGCKMKHAVGADQDSIVYKDYGSEPAKIQMDFQADDTNGQYVFLGYGGYINSDQFELGGMALLATSDGDLYAAHFNTSGAYAWDSARDTNTLTNGETYTLQIEISTVGASTTIVSKIYNSVMTELGSRSQAYTNTLWSNNIYFGFYVANTTAEIIVDNIRVWNT